MPELLPQPSGNALSEAPRPVISPSEVAAPGEEFANTLRQAGNAMTDISVVAAKHQAASDLLAQKVTRNADGSINVENPDSAPLLFGPAGTAYEQAMAAGTVAHVSNAVSERLEELHTKFPADPSGFQAASDQFLQNLGTGLPPELHEAVQREGQQLQRQHANAITGTAANLDIYNQRNAIVAQIEDLKNTAVGLSRKDGTNTPEFLQTRAKLDAAYDALGSNPLFKTSPDQIAIEKKNTHALLQGEAVVGTVDQTFTKKGKGAAQQVLEDSILKNPNMSESDRSRLYAQGMSRLQFLSSDAAAAIEANHGVVGDMENGIARGTLSPDDPAVGMAIQRAQQLGDVAGVQRLTAAAAVQRLLRGADVLPDAERTHVLGAGGSEPVNQSVPPEGRALLRQIGATESGNRYDIRYSPGGGVTFSGFADHPDIAAPITTGPDAGNVSTAAGYYQFSAPTWQTEKAKLGLADFSPANQDAAAWDLAQTTYQEKTGKDLLTVLRSGNRSEIAGVLPALSGVWSSLPGGRQPAPRYLAPSISGGPGFTAADVQRNPFLLSAYVRTLAYDPDLRVQSAKQTAAAIGKTINNGSVPDPAAVAEVNQAAKLYPSKLGSVADEMNGRIAGMKIAGLPEDQRAAIIQSYQAATAGPDVHQVNLASAALAQVQVQQKNLADHPLVEAARRGWTAAPQPIDPTQPNTIAPVLAQRAALSARIGALNHMPAPPLLDSDDMPKLQAALQSPSGAAVLGSIARTLKPDGMQTLVGQKGFRDAVTGMSRSGDPAKMNAAFSLMDSLQKQNPLLFDQQFKDGLKDLRAWQNNLAFYPPDVAAKRLMAAYDPAQVAARKASDDVADAALKNVSANQVVSKFSTGWGPFGIGARAPVAQQAGIAAGALKSDYDQNYKNGFALTGDPAAADNYAMEKLRLKYAVSPTNNNRVMAYAPERYYPQVGGSYDWMTQQLDQAVARQFGVPNEADRELNRTEALAATDSISGPLMDERSPAERKYDAPRALVSDSTTEQDIANHKPPSYQIIMQDPNGRWSAMSAPNGTPLRFRFDPAPFFAARAADMEQRRAVMDVDQLQPLTSVVPAL